MAKSPQHDLPSELWLEIFRYATYIPLGIARPDPFCPKSPITNIMDYNTPFFSVRTKCNLVLVCRFWRQVAIEILYEHIAITSPRRAKLLLAALQAVPLQRGGDSDSEATSTANDRMSYGQWTRSIEVYTHARGGSSQSYLLYISCILRYCPNVHMLRCHWSWAVPPAFFDSLARLYGNALKSLEWNEATLPSKSWVHPMFLAAFQSLRVLDIRYIAPCDPTIPRPTSSKLTLPHLTELLLSDTVPSLNVAASLDIPAFHRLSVELVQTNSRHLASRMKAVDNQIKVFLRTHGPKITQLEFVCKQLFIRNRVDARQFLRPGVCPNLVDLVLHDGHPVLKPSSGSHPTLRRIGLRVVCPEKLSPDKPSIVTRHLRSFMSGMFPSLEVVRTLSYEVDSDDDEMARDVFIWWAEQFERHGIDFQDGEGVLWMYTDPVCHLIDEDSAQ